MLASWHSPSGAAQHQTTGWPSSSQSPCSAASGPLLVSMIWLSHSLRPQLTRWALHSWTALHCFGLIASSPPIIDPLSAHWASSCPSQIPLSYSTLSLELSSMYPDSLFCCAASHLSARHRPISSLTPLLLLRADGIHYGSSSDFWARLLKICINSEHLWASHASLKPAYRRCLRYFLNYPTLIGAAHCWPSNF